MKQVLIHKGAAVVTDVPSPRVEPGEVLVRVRTSCLSVGTEMSGVRQSAIPLWKKALHQPEKVATTLRMLATQGIRRTWSLIEERRDAAHPTGYSAAGVVVETGSAIRDLAPGDRVACAGAQYAHHAEFIRVPRNLCVLLPEDLDWAPASTVTLGAIALQGVRRAQPTLGETFVVIGLGILGQLTIQLLRAAGCRTIGVDIDARRITLARELGMDAAVNPDESGDSEQVARLTDGYGADGVIIKMCRKKGRVVLVGDVGLSLDRADFYAKEIDFLISSSYGPGRYDNRYEEQGLDYPLAFVRWTENRNMGEYLRLLSEKRVRTEPLVSARFPIADASAAYASLGGDSKGKPMMVLLDYPETETAPVRTVTLPGAPARREGRIRVAVIGAGGFARSAHLPNLGRLSSRFELHSVVGRSGPTALAAAKQFGARHASTDFDAVLADAEVDAVIIATRHHLHATMALAALKAGKHVLLEKPLALNAGELAALDAHMQSRGGAPGPVLLTGFNRRFSPYARRMKKLLQERSSPFMLNYRMNAGFLPADHWVHGVEGGGRNIGEACHIYDLFTYLADAKVTGISAQSITPAGGQFGRNDNFVATLAFAEGSLATLTYTALGARDFPKETGELFVDGKVAALEDYRRLNLHGVRSGSLRTTTQEKGLLEELQAFADSIQTGEWAIPWWQQLEVTRASFAVEQALQPAKPNG
jgi:predicted dehydrogenase/threonine dehydrogenase-like Zn-dependent dehydrogenase